MRCFTKWDVLDATAERERDPLTVRLVLFYCLRCVAVGIWTRRMGCRIRFLATSLATGTTSLNRLFFAPFGQVNRLAILLSHPLQDRVDICKAIIGTDGGDNFMFHLLASWLPGCCIERNPTFPQRSQKGMDSCFLFQSPLVCTSLPPVI